MPSDPDQPERCQNPKCGIKLHSTESKRLGYCSGCREAKKQIGPDRPKG